MSRDTRSAIPLCALDAIENDCAKGFEIDGLSLFAVKSRGRVTVYVNRCPHAGLPLNWLPDQFLDTEKELIQCSSHGALFRIDNGHCVAGPCAGRSLQAVPFSIENGCIWLSL